MDEKTGRKFYLDDPDDLKPGEKLTFLLNLHGGGSVGAWQRAYFPAVDYKNKYRLVIATPSAATKEPARRWVGEADDEHLHNIVELRVRQVRRGEHRRLLAGRPQPGRHDLAAGCCARTPSSRIGSTAGSACPAGASGRPNVAEDVRPPLRARRQARRMPIVRPAPAGPPPVEMSLIFTVGEHEIKSLPETSPWAEKYGAGPRQRRPDIVDTEPRPDPRHRPRELFTKELGPATAARAPRRSTSIRTRATAA